MRIQIIAAGKVREPWLVDGIAEYSKRLSKYCTVEIIEVQDSPDTLPTDVALTREGEKILAQIRENALVVALDLHGKMYDSVAFSEELVRLLEAGGSSITFVIGGSNGLSPALLARSDKRICLSPMTFTHQMTRLILLEQCYRAFKIVRGERYHK
jgi:23S rRNA (pseudouridine1915-N3)-methyltransferase